MLDVIKQKLKEGKAIGQEKGILHLAWRIIGLIHRNSIRHILPTIGHYFSNEVLFFEKKLFDDWFYWPRSRSDTEGGIIRIHELETQQSDKVTIVGGGSGISCVRAARIVGETGQVTVYEGGRESANRVEQTVMLNDVDDICEINQCVVGQPRNVYGGDYASAPIKSPQDLDDCDVLELDCEGSEIDILPGMNILPRVVIVEIHPMNFDESEDAILHILEDRGYAIKWKFGHDGTEINEKQLKLLLENSKNGGNKHIANGARYPVVVGATLT